MRTGKSFRERMAERRSSPQRTPGRESDAGGESEAKGTDESSDSDLEGDGEAERAAAEENALLVVRRPARYFDLGTSDFACADRTDVPPKDLSEAPVEEKARRYDDRVRKYVYSHEPMPGAAFGGRRMDLPCSAPGVGGIPQQLSIPCPCGTVPMGAGAGPVTANMGPGSRFARSIGDGRGKSVLERADLVADDGIYVPPRPPVPPAAEAAFEARIVRERAAQALREREAGAGGSADDKKAKRSRRRRGDDDDGGAGESKGDDGTGAASDTAEALPDADGSLVPTLGDPLQWRQTRLEDAGDDEEGERVLAQVETEVLRPVSGGEVRDAVPTRLDVRIGTVNFDDHPLFGREDYLYSALRIMYAEYMRRLDAGVVEHYGERLAALLAPELSGDGDMDEAQKDLEVRCEEVLESLSQQFSEATYVDELTARMYGKWKELKLQRDESKEICTPAKLTVKKVEGDIGRGAVSRKHVSAAERLVERVARDNPRWRFLEDGRDMLGALRKFGESRKRYVVRLTHDETYTTDATCTPQERKRRQSARRTQVYCRLMVNDKPVGATRRLALAWPRFSVTPDTTLTLHLVRRPTRMAIEVYEWGVLWDSLITTVPIPIPGRENEGAFTSGFGPDAGVYQFAAATPIRNWAFARPAPASDAPGRARTVASRERFTMGTVGVSVAWGGRGDMSRTAAPLPERGVSLAEGRVLKVGVPESRGQGDDEEIPEFVREVDYVETVLKPSSRLDPNDPRNSDIVRMRDWVNISDVRGTRFRVQNVSADLAFNRGLAPRHKVRRHRLFQIRRTNPALLQEQIPLREDEIRASEALSKLLREGADMSDEEDASDEEASFGEGAEAAQAARERAMKDFFKRARMNNQRLFRRRRGHRTVDLVKEGPLPDLRGIDLAAILSVFEPRRALRPRAAPRVRAQVGGDQKCHIVVTIASCKNVPSRRDTEEASAGAGGGRGFGASQRGRSRKDSYMGDLGVAGRRGSEFGDGAAGAGEPETDVVSFVEVEFGMKGAHAEVKATKTLTGATPRWQQTLSLTFEPPRRSFKPEHLKKITDSLTVTLFDEITMETTPDRRQAGAVLTTTEKRFLGTISIPFNTIYTNGQIDGQVQLRKPVANLGYKATHHVDPGHTEEEAGSGDQVAAGIVHPSAETYVKLRATLDPPLPLPNDDDSEQPRGESRKVMAMARRFERTHNTKDRHITVLATDMNGNAVLLNRYLTPQRPPPDPARGADVGLSWDDGGSVQKRMHSVDAIVRYVSLVPFIDDMAAQAGGQDMWCTSEEFLGLGGGDSEEHAILLNNYFLWLEERGQRPTGWDTYLCLGRGVVEGDTVYVMRQKQATGEVVLWDATTGRGYAATNDLCPLHKIGMVVNRHNCWANVQKVEAPWEISWELENAKMWQPLWTPAQRPDTSWDRQRAELVYQPTPAEFVAELEGVLAAAIKTEFRTRRTKVTRFHTQASTKLKSLLEDMEATVLNASAVDVTPEHLHTLERTLRGFKNVHGFPLNFPFKDVDEIVEAVMTTDVHEVTGERVQFAIATRVFPYPNMVCSVWVYVAALIPEEY